MKKKHVIGDYTVMKAAFWGYKICKLVSLNPSNPSLNNIFWMSASKRYAKRADAVQALRKIQAAQKK